MNMKGYKAYLRAALILLLIGSTAGCFEEYVSGEYDGPPRVQFYPTGGTVVDGTGEVALNVQLISPHLPEDKQFSVSVVDSTTTAQAGVHYNLVTETFAIPANSSFGEVVVDVNSAGLAPGTAEQLTLLLGPSQDGEVTPAANFERFTMIIAGRAADVSIDPTSVSFDSTAVGEMVTDTVMIANAGNLETVISGLAIASDTSSAFSVVDAPADPFTIAAETSQALIIQFAPTEAGAVGAELTFMVSNDPDTEELGAGLEGIGFTP